jgi:hypothetical protein
VRATTRTWRRRGVAGRFAVTLPVEVLAPGANAIAVHLVERDGGRARLRAIAPDAAPPRP